MPWSALVPLAVLASGCYAGGGEPTGEAVQFVHTVCATATTVRGVDVSIYQGTIDWAAAARGGIQFVIIRHSHGATTDTNFVRNWNGARGAGILHGAYQYFDPWSDPAAQANAIVDGLMGVNFGVGDLPPTLDVEQPSNAGDPPLPSPTDYTARIRTWVGVIRTRLGVDPIIYTGGYYWDQYVRSNAFADLPLWHAQYFNYPGTIYRFDVTPLPGMSCPSSISDAWPRWAFWQFAGGNGRAPGFSGAVDCDVFNGTMAQLRALTVQPAPDGGMRGDASSGDGGPSGDAGDTDGSAGDGGPTQDVASDAATGDASGDGASGDGASRDAGTGHTTGGCGCRAASTSRGSLAGTLLGLGALALVGARRRRRIARVS